MLEIYKRDEFNGRLKIINIFDSFEDLFRRAGYRYDFATSFGYTDTDRHDNGTAAFGDHQPPSKYFMGPVRDFCYIALEDGKFVTPDRLVGLYRDYVYDRKDWWKLRNAHWRQGRKKSAWGWIRNMRTTQELRWAKAWDDEEDAPKYRAKRSNRNLPSAWDDYWSNNQKSWKKQSKRNHQWKAK